MINFEKQFDNIESKFKEIESNLNNQSNLDTEKLIKLNKEYAELRSIKCWNESAVREWSDVKLETKKNKNK